MTSNFSPYENYRDNEAIKTGSDRAFGFTVGTVLILIGTIKAFVAAAVPPITFLIFIVGAVLLLLGIIAPARLSTL
jgi:hypothetical protein